LRRAGGEKQIRKRKRENIGFLHEEEKKDWKERERRKGSLQEAKRHPR